MTAPDLMTLKRVVEMIPEPAGGAHHSWEATADAVKAAVLRHNSELKQLGEDELKDRRYEKFRAFGEWSAGAAVA